MDYAQRHYDAQQEEAQAYQTMKALLPGPDREYWQAKYQALRIEIRALERRIGTTPSETKRGR